MCGIDTVWGGVVPDSTPDSSWGGLTDTNWGGFTDSGWN